MSTLAQERYGRRSTPGRRRLLLAAGALALATALGFIGWVTLYGRPSVNWSEVGYNVVSDNEIEVTFDISFSGSSDSGSGAQSAVCSVQALNTLGTEVGLRDVVVPAGPKGRARTTATVQTSERATTGLIKSCTRANE
ncbi:MAG TPA: DUF4307 domain-containing protein [Kineosporiaceae bacterium]|nr:DUF4307 domain-containing protein [Kineosporiaceae bacterium]